jgi:hypothetical protein
MTTLLKPWVVLIGSAIMLGLTVVTLLVGLWIILHHGGATASDQIAATGAAFGAATFILAALAALVALFAYQVAAQAPSLVPEIKFWFCPTSEISLI